MPWDYWRVPGAMPLNISVESNPKRATNTAPRDAKAPSLAEGPALTTNQGVRIPDDDNSLKAGARRPTLLGDVHFRKKIMHFDHEPMPERVVHPLGQWRMAIFRHTSRSGSTQRDGDRNMPSLCRRRLNAAEREPTSFATLSYPTQSPQAS